MPLASCIQYQCASLRNRGLGCCYTYIEPKQINSVRRDREFVDFEIGQVHQPLDHRHIRYRNASTSKSCLLDTGDDCCQLTSYFSFVLSHNAVAIYSLETLLKHPRERPIISWHSGHLAGCFSPVAHVMFCCLSFIVWNARREVRTNGSQNGLTGFAVVV